MARVDDYKMSFDLAAEKLVDQDFGDLAKRAGAEPVDGGAALTMKYYGRPVKVTKDPMTVEHLDEGPEIPLAEQALILHYLANADGALPSGEWITYREVESGEFYWSAFVKRAKAPLLKLCGENAKLLTELAPEVGGEGPGDSGDASAVIRAFPNVPIMLIVYEGDDEFPADGNVLFDRTIEHYFNTEDIAWAAGMPIYKMMAIYYSR